MRDPQWDGVVDGEVCGQGALAESIKTFLYWVPVKLGTNDALRLCVSCGDALVREVCTVSRKGLNYLFRGQLGSITLVTAQSSVNRWLHKLRILFTLTYLMLALGLVCDSNISGQ